MGAVQPVLYEPVFTVPVVETVKGGQLVEARTGGVGVAAADSAVTVGVALIDGVTTGDTATTTDALGNSVVDWTQPPLNISVHRDCVIKMTYAAVATYMQKLKAAANGQVTPLLAGDDMRKYVGTCQAVAGVASGASGLTHVNPL